MARFEIHKRDTIYRVYVTDALYAATRGLPMAMRYAEVANLIPEKPVDNRTQEEIVAQVWRGINGG